MAALSRRGFRPAEAAFRMTGCNQETFGFIAHFSRRVEAGFTAGKVSTDDGRHGWPQSNDDRADNSASGNARPNPSWYCGPPNERKILAFGSLLSTGGSPLEALRKWAISDEVFRSLHGNLCERSEMTDGAAP
jgi:hypothetical protein